MRRPASGYRFFAGLLLGALLPLLWPIGALAGGVLNPAGYNSWELYVFGNGPVVWNVLNSVSAMVGDGGYHDLLEFVGVLGIFGAAIVAGFDASKMPRMLAFTLGAFFVLYISLDVTANIMVDDPVSGYTNVATGVPAVVGVPAAVISDIGHWLTQKVEQDFSIPGDLTVAGGNGFDLANSLIQDATRAQITDPYLRQSFATYISNCVMPAMANGTMNASTILNATDLWSTIQSTNQGILTPVYTSANPQGSLESCAQAWTDIGNTLQTEAPALISANANQWSNTASSNFLGQALGSSLSFLSNNGVNQSADQALLNTAAINMFNSSFQQSAALTGNNALMTSMAAAQAEQSQTSSWFTTARVFNDMMGYVYSVLQAFLFAITPILMAALLMPGFGMTILKNFAQVLLWLILWEPMLAIVNYIIALYGQQSYGGIMSAAGGITDSNLPVMSSESAHMVLAAGFLGTMVPIIAWGLVKGSLAFSDFIMAGVSSSFSGAAGAAAATGNVTLDNQSANNDSFNHKDFTHSLSYGQGPQVSTAGLGSTNNMEQFGGQASATARGVVQESQATSVDGAVGTSSNQAHGLSTQQALQRQAAEKAEATFSQSLGHQQQTISQVTHGMTVSQASDLVSGTQTGLDAAIGSVGSQGVSAQSLTSVARSASLKAQVTGGVKSSQAAKAGVLDSVISEVKEKTAGMSGVEKTAIAAAALGGLALAFGTGVGELVTLAGGAAAVGGEAAVEAGTAAVADAGGAAAAADGVTTVAGASRLAGLLRTVGGGIAGYWTADMTGGGGVDAKKSQQEASASDAKTQQSQSHKSQTSSGTSSKAGVQYQTQVMDTLQSATTFLTQHGYKADKSLANSATASRAALQALQVAETASVTSDQKFATSYPGRNYYGVDAQGHRVGSAAWSNDQDQALAANAPSGGVSPMAEAQARIRQTGGTVAGGTRAIDGQVIPRTNGASSAALGRKPGMPAGITPLGDPMAPRLLEAQQQGVGAAANHLLAVYKAKVNVQQGQTSHTAKEIAGQTLQSKQEENKEAGRSLVDLGFHEGLAALPWNGGTSANMGGFGTPSVTPQDGTNPSRVGSLQPPEKKTDSLAQ
ncbi:conjugal transfer protein TraG N-terminal domain-containing protein [Thiomonas sp.]